MLTTRFFKALADGQPPALALLGSGFLYLPLSLAVPAAAVLLLLIVDLLRTLWIIVSAIVRGFFKLLAYQGGAVIRWFARRREARGYRHYQKAQRNAPPQKTRQQHADEISKAYATVIETLQAMPGDADTKQALVNAKLEELSAKLERLT